VRLSSHNFDLDQLAELTGQPRLARASEGPCDQCPGGKVARVRYVYGAFELCHRCASHRLRMAAKVGHFDAQTKTKQLHQAVRDQAGGTT
jgi:hypothetical protein